MRIIQGPLDIMKHNSICTIEVSEGEERVKGIGNLFKEIMRENALLKLP